MLTRCLLARGHERGSVTVFTVVFAIAVMFLLALIIDGGIAMNARQRAADIAGQAALADLTAGSWCAPRSVAVLVTGYPAAGAQVATVQVTVTTSPLVPGVFGPFHETASASATTECGITLGGAC